LLRVISSPDKFHEHKEILFHHSTTTGIRYHEVRRIKLRRRVTKVETPFGTIRVKIIEGLNRKTFIHPEYDDLKKIANEQGISLREAEQSLQRIFAELKF